MNVFISYRRVDSQYIADRVRAELVKHLGKDNVFKDDGIRRGTDFTEEIRKKLAQCNVLLVIIGEKWLSATDEHGKRRLDNPDDWVRFEIEYALANKIRIMPLRADGAPMPRADQLPSSLARLVNWNGGQIRPDPDFDHDMQLLLTSLNITWWRRLRSLITLTLVTLIAVIGVWFGALGGTAYWNPSPDAFYKASGEFFPKEGLQWVKFNNPAPVIDQHVTAFLRSKKPFGVQFTQRDLPWSSILELLTPLHLRGYRIGPKEPQIASETFVTAEQLELLVSQNPQLEELCITLGGTPDEQISSTKAIGSLTQLRTLYVDDSLSEHADLAALRQSVVTSIFAMKQLESLTVTAALIDDELIALCKEKTSFRMLQGIYDWTVGFNDPSGDELHSKKARIASIVVLRENGRWNSAKRLDFAFTNISSGIQTSLIQQSEHLEELGVDNRFLSDETFKVIVRHSRLRLLRSCGWNSTDGCNYCEEKKGEVNWRQNVTDWRFSKTKLTESSLVMMKEFPTLQDLYLSGTPVQNLSPLRECTSLKTIDLLKTGVTDLSPLYELPNLLKVYVDDPSLWKGRSDVKVSDSY